MSEVTYAIGDIHGCSHHLRGLLNLIYNDFRDGGYEFGKIVFTGDYVDRGPDSKGVLDILMTGPDIPELQWITLKGNHEDMMLGNDYFWIRNGGDATLRSFEAKSLEGVDRKYLNFLHGLWMKYEDGRFFFVHAGVNPEYELKDQLPMDMLWIRNEFLASDKDFGQIIVHGHTPRAGTVDFRANRINIDSGCYFSGILSALKYDDETGTSVIQFSDTGKYKSLGFTGSYYGKFYHTSK